MTIPIAFIICTEPGRLERQSLLLAESIRNFAGEFKDVPIFSFHPRQGESIASQTKQAFKSLNVEHEQIVLNTKYHDYYLANKPLVCAYAEQNIDAEILVFLDSDKCFFYEPKQFLLPENFNIGLRPEYGRGIGSKGKQDLQDGYWQKLYQLLNVKQEFFVQTPIGKTRIRGYWNSGMVAVKRKAGIFTSWKDNFQTVMEAGVEPSQGNYMVEQSVLAATVCSRKENVFTFSSNYSYPLPLHNRLANEFKVYRLEDVVSIHYFNMFYYQNWPQRLNNLRDFQQHTEKYNWLCEKIVQYDMPFRKISHDYLLKMRKIEKKLRIFKININVSNFIEKIIET
ncbi:MAG: hypothetical protein ACFCU5_04040 [Pleurocapsa sp.]